MFTQVITQFSLSPKNCLANIWQLPNYEKTGIPEIDSPYARGHHGGGGAPGCPAPCVQSISGYLNPTKWKLEQLSQLTLLLGFLTYTFILFVRYKCLLLLNEVFCAHFYTLIWNSQSRLKSIYTTSGFRIRRGFFLLFHGFQPFFRRLLVGFHFR